jgi:predicted lipid-binding transport protein (Tim44 family)
MGGSDGFPIDLILFGMIAAFLVLRLRSILGRRTGFERQQAQRGPVAVPGVGRPVPPVIDGKATPVAPSRPLPDPATPLGASLQRLRQVDRNFDPARFLSGAEAAFRMIVKAFADGDRVTLRSLLADETYRGFEQAIAARETNGETQRTEIRDIPTVSIETASLAGTVASIAVKFVSDQVAETLDRDGKPLVGSDAVTEIIDLWTFERDLTSSDPAWRLTAARSG